MPATLSVNGLYQYDNTLFNGLVLPPLMDKAVQINYIIAECAELETTITDPNTLKIMIESWSLSRLHSWQRLYESTVQKYDMIHNYDRYEEWTDNGNASGAYSNTGTYSNTGGGTSTEKKAGYNDTSLVTASEITNATSNSGTNNEANNKTENNNNSHKGHMYGNIGVTTAAQMIQGERDISAYDVYMAITDEFKRKFCVCVY